jgi:DNA-directed RNA polymerase specialized sigma24 family protein
VGTVMSRLARGRARLREGWERQHAPKTGTGMRGSHGS